MRQVQSFQSEDSEAVAEAEGERACGRSQDQECYGQIIRLLDAPFVCFVIHSMNPADNPLAPSDYKEYADTQYWEERWFWAWLVM